MDWRAGAVCRGVDGFRSRRDEGGACVFVGKEGNAAEGGVDARSAVGERSKMGMLWLGRIWLAFSWASLETWRMAGWEGRACCVGDLRRSRALR